MLNYQRVSTTLKNLVGGFKHVYFPEYMGTIIPFDQYFSEGLKPPTSNIYTHIDNILLHTHSYGRFTVDCKYLRLALYINSISTLEIGLSAIWSFSSPEVVTTLCWVEVARRPGMPGGGTGVFQPVLESQPSWGYPKRTSEIPCHTQ